MTHRGSDDSGRVPGGTFNGPVSLQIGDGNTMEVHHHVAAKSPLDATADELARVVGDQWQEEAGFRRLLQPAPLPVRWRVTERKVAGRLVGATAEGARARFAPLPGLRATGREALHQGGGLAELHEVYGGLASGRLLLVGGPAAGKTAAAVLLLLDALTYRARAAPENRADIPVPVLLPLDGWDPAQESAVEWAAGRLCREYTLFRGSGGRELARRLLKSDRIALLLDGLDEVTGKLRAAMVSALESAPFRLVLVSRAREAVLTAKKARLAGAVALELQPVDPREAAEYLLTPLPEPTPPAWRALTDRAVEDPDSAVARALSSPLAIALLRDSYPEDGPVDELLDDTRFPDAHAIENHLLDHAVAAAYTPRSGQPRPRHSPESAERTLRHLAARLTREGTRDLRWWSIPTWTDRRPRAVLIGALVALVYGAVGTFLILRVMSTTWAFLLVPLGGLAGGFVAGQRHWSLTDEQSLPSAGWRDLFPPRALGISVGTWLFAANVLWLGSHVGSAGSLPAWLCYLTTLPLGFSTMLASGRGSGLLVSTYLGFGSGPGNDDLREKLSPPPVADTRSVGPRDVWRHHAVLRLLLGLLVGLAVALLVTPVLAWEYGVLNGLLVGGTAGLWCALVAGPAGNLAVATALSAVQLSARQGTPVRLVSFLEDARRRNLLRATGPVYQFRHARLQERLSRPR
ncbi:hypothetical protein [Streptomyces sp. HD]|uniref:hypothetical protein n=1 Tax=Streptomyces sp. HD TaxID=3020892 RepID=UPI00232F26F6|nr:hypothetical protein [Streptomyces sp. HD]MDC0768252.1 hypothetical protein [Streptomyces sp. HD]